MKIFDQKRLLEKMEVNPNEMDMKLTDLPPEICEHICQMLPSLSLFNMPTISEDFQNIATREIDLRHQKVKTYEAWNV